MNKRITDRRKDSLYRLIIQSLAIDIHVIENEYRLFKARVVAIWFIVEIGAVLIPNVSFPTERSAAYALDGYEECSVVAISTKSHLQDKVEYERLLWKIRFTVDHLKLKAIVV